MPSITNAYHARLCRVLEHIDAHLDDDLSVDELSAVAAFSKFHFHRLFSGLLGLGVHRYVRLVRLRRASHQLVYREHMPIVEIALASGYDSHEAFARAFKQVVGQTPSEFRGHPQWLTWHETFSPLSELRSEHMKPDYDPESVKTVHVEETPVAVLEHRGDPRRIGDSVRKFIAWRKQNHLPPRLSATFNVLYDDPLEVAAEDFRMDLCAATTRPVADNEFGVVQKSIPGGRCAVLRHVGSEDKLFQAVSYLYSSWLPASGEELRDFPPYLQRIRFFPDVPETEAVTDIFLPLR